MVEANLQTAADAQAGDMTENDQDMLRQVVAAINAKMKVGCTGCGYCMPCPKGVDIPALFRCYNQMYTEGKAAGRKEYWQTVSLRKERAFARQCVGCGKCEMHCPQHIAIRQELKNAKKELEGPLYRIIAFLVRKLKVFG